MLANTLIAPALRFANLATVESPWKNRARAAMLRLRNGLPREIMVRRGDHVVQVGMWRENNLLRLSRCVGPKGRVLLIEADRRVVRRLEPLLRRRGIANVSIVNAAANDVPGEIEFRVAQSPDHNRLGDSSNRMLNEQGRDVFTRTEKINADRVDNLLRGRGFDRVDYVEVTVNGLEERVLRGMEETLAVTRRVFVAGYARTPDGAPTNRATRHLLQRHGFRTTISCKTAPTQEDFDPESAASWGRQEGHVFAWRE